VSVAEILVVDLTSEQVARQSLPQKTLDQYLGGRGLGAYLLYHAIGSGVNPLSPDNVLVFTAGPLHGADAPYSSKSVLTTRSPLTGIYLYSICSSGFSHQLAKAGFAALIVKGRADRPIYLAIQDGQVRFLDAAGVWGSETPAAQDLMLRGAGLEGAACLAIGPAGERMAPMAIIVSGGGKARAFGRGGAGAVMGSKLLKGIVLKGTGVAPVADPAGFRQAKQSVRSRMQQNPTWMETWRRFGSGQDIELVSELGLLPTRNWSSGVFDQVQAIAPARNFAEYPRKAGPCGAYCYSICGQEITLQEGPYAGTYSDGPEYETLYSFGSNCGVDEYDAVVAAESICDRQGLDTMSVGVAVGFAMECYQRGLLTQDQCDGLDLRFGNAGAMVDAVRNIAAGRGLGKLLGQGVRVASQVIPGSQGFAMHGKGMELGGLESRGAWGQSLEYLLSSRGGCHHAYGRPALAEVQQGTGAQVAGKGELVKRLASARIIYDCAVMCTFPSGILGLEAPLALINAVTGRSLAAEDAATIGLRVITMERLFNVREGLRRKDDVLPDRLTVDPAPDGPGQGLTVPVAALLDDGYAAMGWDADGVPTGETLARVGINGDGG
jgi:aldehyde:ferredoxin oxidoreductase